MAADLSEDFEEQVERLHAEIELLRDLSEVTRLVSEPDPARGILERICALAGTSLPGCEVGMSLGGQVRDLESGASSSERAERLDRAQRATGEGPCLSALADQTPHEAVGGELTERWPTFGPVAAADGVEAVLAVPFLVEGRSRGALNVYAMDAARLDDRARRLTSLLAEPAAAALANAQLYHRSAELARNLSIAMESRGVIEQAKGIIMFRRRCSEEDAFARLRQVSQDHNIKVRDLAQQVVSHAAAFPAEGTAPPAPLAELLRPAEDAVD